MPKPETLHGDEELIEEISGTFYEVLEPHCSSETGQVDVEAARDDVILAYVGLMIGEDGRVITDPERLAAIDSGYLDAAQTHIDKQAALDWM